VRRSKVGEEQVQGCSTTQLDCRLIGDSVFDLAGEKKLIEVVLWKWEAEVAQYWGWKDSHVGAACYEDER
jgi:hypothetical protein